MIQDKRYRIAVSLIVGDEASDESLQRLIDSARWDVDGIYILYNGDEDNFPYNVDWRGITSVIDFADWTDDFSEARNAAFAMIPRADYDWILWLDSDDAVEQCEISLQEMIEGLHPSTQVVFMHYKYNIAAGDRVTVDTMRERMFRADLPTLWVDAIHETCTFPAGVGAAHRMKPSIEHDYQARGGTGEKRERNRRILQAALKKNPGHVKYQRYLGDELYAEAFDQIREGGEAAEHATKTYLYAYRAYQNYLRADPTAGEASYICLHRMAECMRAVGNYDQAEKHDMENIRTRPDRPESYIGMAGTMLYRNHWPLAESWADRAMELPRMVSSQHGVERDTIEFLPLLIKAQANDSMGNIGRALDFYRQATEMVPEPTALARIAELEARVEGVLDTVGTYSMDEIHAKVRDTRPERSICFVTKGIGEEWNREIIDSQGSGGTEYVVMQTATQFAQDGWRVAIYGSPGDWRGRIEEFEGGGTLEWWATHLDVDITARWKYVVGLRTTEFFETNWNCERSFLWMHDVNIGQVPASPWGDVWQSPDGFIVPSAWHGRHLAKLYPVDQSKILVIPNGYDADLFKGSVEGHIPGKLVYTSSPDRGLDVLLQYWPYIKELMPEATLDIFYGWDFIDKFLKDNPDHPIREVKDSINAAYEYMNSVFKGITWHDRVSRADLAQHIRDADVWTYPTYFMETHCISAVESQSLGIIPCTTRLAALQETVAIQNFAITGYPRNITYTDEWVSTLHKIVAAPEEAKASLRQIGMDFAKQFSWDNTYDAWRTALGIESPTIVSV